MTLLSDRAGVGLLGEGVDEQQVVCLDGEGRPLDKMAEVSDGSMDGEQLPIEGGVARLGRRELPTEEGKRLSGTVEDLLEDGTNGSVTSVGGEDKEKTRRREFEVSSVREGPFCVAEGCSLRRAPVEGLGFPSEGGVERSHGGGDVRQEFMVVVDHADKLLQGLHSGGHRKGTNRSNLLLQGEDALRRDIMSQEVDLLGPEDICCGGGQDQQSRDVQGPGEGDASALQEWRRRRGCHQRRQHRRGDRRGQCLSSAERWHQRCESKNRNS